MGDPILDPDRTLDLNVALLDRQVVDSDGVPVCKVDDVVLERDEDGDWRPTEVLLGPGALGPRLGGRLGATLSGLHRRLRGLPEPAPPRIPWRAVSEIGSDVRLGLPLAMLPPDLTPLEDWLREHVIARIPGSRHESG